MSSTGRSKNKAPAVKTPATKTPKAKAPQKAKKPAKPAKIKYDSIPRVDRKAAATKRTKRRPLSIAVRREVKRMLQQKERMNAILLRFQSVGITQADVWNIAAGRVKTDYTRRADKGQKRGARTTAEREAIAAPIDSGLSFDDLMEDGVRTALEDLRIRPSVDPFERAIALERLQRVRRHGLALRITGHLKRTDALVIARIVRKYVPTATDEDIVLIYKECQALVAAELNEN